MKKFLLAVGIILIAAAVLSLLFAAFCRHAYLGAMDASHEQLERLLKRAVVCFAAGLVLAAVGTACLIIRLKV